MAIFLLHFECRGKRADSGANRVTAEACALGESLEQAERLAREAIRDYGYEDEALIAYSEVDKAHVAALSEYETILYLKAQKGPPGVAVMFS